MIRLAFKPEYDYVMIQYKNGQKFQEYRLSVHEIMEYDSKDPFSKHIFEILTLLGVDEENISLVGQAVGELTKWPNQIWYSGKAGKILTALANRFPAEDTHTDGAMMARQGFHSLHPTQLIIDDTNNVPLTDTQRKDVEKWYTDTIHAQHYKSETK
jgi:hypothetical protein